MPLRAAAATTATAPCAPHPLAASLALLERQWKLKRNQLQASKDGYAGLVADANALEARIEAANKRLKARLLEQKQAFAVRAGAPVHLPLAQLRTFRATVVSRVVCGLGAPAQEMGRRDITDLTDLPVGEPWMSTLMHALCVLHDVDADERTLPDNAYVKVGHRAYARARLRCSRRVHARGMGGWFSGPLHTHLPAPRCWGVRVCR